MKILSVFGRKEASPDTVDLEFMGFGNVGALIFASQPATLKLDPKSKPFEVKGFGKGRC